MRDSKKTTVGIQLPHSPLMAEINTEKLRDAISLNHDTEATIADSYITNSNALIELLMDEEFKEHPNFDAIFTAMYQQHLLLYYNLTENDANDESKEN